MGAKLAGDATAAGRAIDELVLRASVAGILNRRACVGLAFGVVRGGRLEFFLGHGLADVESHAPVTEDTIFRIGSVTKTMTAIAVMQLWERGLVDLDAPANDYLRAFHLVPARQTFRPATVRHLLTHTAGLREARRLTDMFRWRDMGETVKATRPVPSLAEYYRGGLRVDADPGSRCMYTDHGFAALGQLVEDVAGVPLAHYLDEHIFQPLGMVDTSLERPAETSRLATGYELRPQGAERIPDYNLITLGGGGVYSTPREMARYLAALTGGGGNEHGRVLRPQTLAMMFESQHQRDPRLTGIGLAFFLPDLGGHRGVSHGGTLPGFDSAICAAPDDGVAVMAFANGAQRGLHWLEFEADAVLRQVLGAAPDGVPADVPHHPETWSRVCGWYSLPAHLIDPARLAFGAGAEVFVRGGRLMVRFLGPMPSLYRGLPLHPVDPGDPYAFRIDLTELGFGTPHAIFTPNALLLDLGGLVMPREPDSANPRVWARRGAAALALTGAGAWLIRRALMR